MKLYIFILVYILSFPMNGVSQGLVEWQKCYGGSLDETAYSITTTEEGGYLIAGASRSNDGDLSKNYGDNDFWIIKINHVGDIIWEKTFGGYANDIAYSIDQTSDKGCIISGATESVSIDVSGNHGMSDAWILKLDLDGNIEWSKCYGGSKFDKAYSIQETLDKGFIVAGTTQSNDGDILNNHGSYDYWILKIDSIGNITWTKNFGGIYDDQAFSIQQTFDHGYILTGQAYGDGMVLGNHGSSDIWVIKLNANGNIEWSKCYGGSNLDYSKSIKQTYDGGYIVCGWTKSNDGDINGFNGFTDLWVIKLNSTGDTVWTKCLGGSHVESASSVQQTLDSGFVISGMTSSINNGDIHGNHGLSVDAWIVRLDKAGDTLWTKCLGGNKEEQANAIALCRDGGYIMAGFAESDNGDVYGNYGGFDFWVVKMSDENSNEPQHEINLVVSPNPSNDFVNLEIKNTGNYTLRIIDIHGKVLLLKTSQEKLLKIDVSNFSQGIYFIEVYNKDYSKVEKFVKN